MSPDPEEQTEGEKKLIIHGTSIQSFDYELTADTLTSEDAETGDRDPS